MPVHPTYPGVYIEEIPSGVRTIVGVSTSVTAFIGFFSRGEMDKATQIFSMTDFELKFGGLNIKSEASYAIQQFFSNGGAEAWVVRTAEAGTAQSSAIGLKDSADGGISILIATAFCLGKWGDNVRIDVDYNIIDPTLDPLSHFNLIVTEIATLSGKQQPVATEIFRNLIIDETLPNHVIDVVNEGSTLIKLSLVGSPTPAQRPAQTGTTSKMLTNTDLSSLLQTDEMDVSLNGGGPDTITLGDPVPTTFAALAATLQTKIQSVNPQLKRAIVELKGSASTNIISQSSNILLQIKAGTDEASDVISFTGGLAAKLGLNDAGRTNVQQYALGGIAKAGQALPNSSQQEGSDGNPPDAAALIGSQSQKTGLYALEDADIFNILCIPRTTNLPDVQASQVATKAEEYCEYRRAFYILDVPHEGKIRDNVDEIKTWLDDNATLRHKNAALYYPRPLIADPLNGFRLRKVAPSGTIAGLYARIDTERGVWKAPAGTEASLRGAQKLEYLLTDQENGALNPLGINCLRRFDIYGIVCWGARTLKGADQMASEWKYIPIRRLALFLEESLYRGTHWVIFEPNDEPLWAQIRLNVGAFMHNLFRQGAFQGMTPREAYFVKCDKETTTQTDINKGVVNIVVGFAPLKPAEFVIIKIQQMAGQIET